MQRVEHLDPSIANEGISANNWNPGAWTNTPWASDEEYQPDMEPPHINDYAAFKKHPHYRQYFRPYRYVAFPAWVYHRDHEPKLIEMRDRATGRIDEAACKREVLALGPGWSPTPIKPRVDMTGKSLPVKTDTQRLTEALVAGLASKQPAGTSVDPNAIAAIVAATVAALNGQASPAPAAEPAPQFELQPGDGDPPSGPEGDSVERDAMIELAEGKGIKVDGRWSNARLRKELGL